MCLVGAVVDGGVVLHLVADQRDCDGIKYIDTLSVLSSYPWVENITGHFKAV
jgi:hypothetical protein